MRQRESKRVEEPLKVSSGTIKEVEEHNKLQFNQLTEDTRRFLSRVTRTMSPENFILRVAPNILVLANKGRSRTTKHALNSCGRTTKRALNSCRATVGVRVGRCRRV
mmetsp:Transcript_36405/g.58446  ORF Transcript_36405/g.58446 Transcript_36405/m.58446 type:complete len:107 (+) Transcript_36405:567-887(+)